MSHQPERKAKDCLNCGTMVHGRFCHICGQENIITHQNFTGLTKHFIYDIFHFDGKFFDTLKYLLFKPGFVAREYVKGRRAKYLDPIRMYLFTSAVFFVLFFSFVNPDLKVADPKTYLTVPQRAALVKELQKKQKQNIKDSSILKKIELLLDTSKQVKRSDIYTGKFSPVIDFGGKQYNSLNEYDSSQNLLPPGKKDGWLERKIIQKGISIDSKYAGNTEEVIRDFFESFLHRMPYLLFLSLPFFALILKLLYIRRKTFFYSDHAIFTLYHYIFSFFILLVIFGFIALKDWLHWELFDWITSLLFLFWFFYLYKSLRNFYGQRRAKTIGKFLLLNLLGFLTMLLLFVIFLFFSIFQM